MLDFLNDTRTIQESFADFYRATVLSDETDPNKLHDLQAELDGAQVYAPQQVEDFVKRYLAGVDRDQLDPVLDACAARYLNDLDEDAQVAFKGSAKAFVRTYAFLSSILPYTLAAWEQRSIFLNFLIPKLPAPQEEDLSKGILEAIDDGQLPRGEAGHTAQSRSPTQTRKSSPCPPPPAASAPSPRSTACRTSSRSSTTCSATSSGRTPTACASSLPRPFPRGSRSTPRSRNARENSDEQNARIEHERALRHVMTALMRDDTVLFKQFMDNPSFNRWMTDTVFALTYKPSQATADEGAGYAE